MSRVSGHVKLVLRKKGPVWYAKYRDAEGHQSQKVLGLAWMKRGRPPEGYFTERTAEDRLQEILTDARRGTVEGAQTRTGKTFADATAKWLRYGEFDKQLSTSTLRDYRRVARQLEEEFGPATALSTIATEAIDEYRERLLSEGDLTRRTVQKRLVLLHGILKRTKRRKWIRQNPAEDAERVSVRRSGDFNVLSPPEVAAVAAAAAVDQDAALYVVAAYTGLRMDELRALRWADVQFEKRSIMVRRNLPAHGEERHPKSGKVRSVPLTDEAARPLAAMSLREHFTEPDDRVFRSPTGGALGDSDMRRGFYKALEAAGLGHMRSKPDPTVFHDCGTRSGPSVPASGHCTTFRATWGHAHVSTTMIYEHHQPKETAADELEAHGVGLQRVRAISRQRTATARPLWGRVGADAIESLTEATGFSVARLWPAVDRWYAVLDAGAALRCGLILGDRPRRTSADLTQGLRHGRRRHRRAASWTDSRERRYGQQRERQDLLHRAGRPRRMPSEQQA